MVDLNNAQVLLLVLVVQQLIAAAAWLLAVQTRVAPRVPGRAWAAAGLLAAFVLLLALLPQGTRQGLTHVLPNALSPVMYFAMRIGLQALFRGPQQPREHLAVAAVALVCAIGGQWVGAAPAWDILYSSLLNAYCLVRAQQCVFPLASAELGRRSTQVLLLPIGVLAVVFALRAVAALTMPGEVAVPLTTPTESNLIVLTLFLCFGVLIHLMLGMTAALRMVNHMRQLAARDPLTGLLNRRGLATQWEGLVKPCCALAVDVDHFKRINDQHGHAMGDAALRHLAELLRREARTLDLAVRVGGEEFLLMLTGTGLAGGLLIADRVRQSVQDRPMRLGELTLPMTVSVGVAEGQNAEAMDALIARADAALYQAKREGRNRVVQAD
jgi:diguanylate cyclase